MNEFSIVLSFSTLCLLTFGPGKPIGPSTPRSPCENIFQPQVNNCIMSIFHGSSCQFSCSTATVDLTCCPGRPGSPIAPAVPFLPYGQKHHLSARSNFIENIQYIKNYMVKACLPSFLYTLFHQEIHLFGHTWVPGTGKNHRVFNYSRFSVFRLSAN